MKQLNLLLAIVVFGVFTSALPRPAAAAWPPLLTCSDVDANGTVTISDIFAVAGSSGATYPSDDYLLLHDLDGGGAIDTGDLFVAAGDFGRVCPLIETQVALATLATIQYRDCQDALADGYVQYTQFVSSMGINLIKIPNVLNYPNFWSGSPADPNDQIRHPIGLTCTDSDPTPTIDVPDQLIGTWYVEPIPEVCPLYGIPGPCNPAEPVGFGLTDDDEDNLDLGAFQKAWHTHSGLCSVGFGTPSAFTVEGIAQQFCVDLVGVWFSTYGWMVHLYNFIPNEDGRFLLFNQNVPPE
jgi:hypothetical protein